MRLNEVLYSTCGANRYSRIGLLWNGSGRKNNFIIAEFHKRRTLIWVIFPGCMLQTWLTKTTSNQYDKLKKLVRVFLHLEPRLADVVKRITQCCDVAVSIVIHGDWLCSWTIMSAVCISLSSIPRGTELSLRVSKVGALLVNGSSSSIDEYSSFIAHYAGCLALSPPHAIVYANMYASSNHAQTFHAKTHTNFIIAQLNALPLHKKIS